MEVVHPLLSVFDSARHETAYRAERLGTDRRPTAALILVVMLPIIVFVRSDMALFGTGELFYRLLGLRLCFVALSIAAAVGALRAKSAAVLDSIFTGWIMAGAAALLAINWTRPPDYLQHVATDVLLVLSVYFVMPGTLARAIGLALLLTAVDVVILVYARPEAESLAIRVAWSSMLLANVVGIVMAHRFQRLARLQFDAVQQERKLKVELEEAYEELRTLRGIVPICSCCKKIRDDKGFWHQVEAYIENHTHARFTHGICPPCLQENYPATAAVEAPNDPITES